MVWRIGAMVVLATWVACDGGGCGGFTELPRGQSTAVKLDAAAALRVSSRGMDFINRSVVADGGLLEQLAPGGELKVPISCNVTPVMVLGVGLENMVIADRGSEGCMSESCGLMDGRCDARDVPQEVTIQMSALSFSTRGPDLIDANVRARISTGKIYTSSQSRSSLLCLLSGGGPVKCGVDFNTARTMPAEANLAINIKLTIDAKWDRLLALEVTDIGGSKVCGGSGAEAPPRCLDANDMVLNNEGACSFCTNANFALFKGIILEQMVGPLKKALNKTVGGLLCTPCQTTADCPQMTGGMSMCRGDEDDGGMPFDAGMGSLDGGAPQGRCVDPATNKCVPRLLGVEGRLALGQSLQSVGVSPTAAVDLGVAVGGSAASSATGVTIGVRGGSKELAVASCVQPIMRPAPPALPLPDLDQGAPSQGYDVALSLSQQFLSDTLFRAQQAGALCLELGQETVAALDSSTLAVLLPSVAKLTTGDAGVPLRLVLRPTNPPTMTVGANTVDGMGRPAEPLLRLAWDDLEIDLYALLFDRYARLFTISTDIALPLGVAVDACGVRPAIGALTSAVSDVRVKNNEMIPEDTTVLTSLVPTLLSMAEPSLSRSLDRIPLPASDGGTGLRVEAIKGVGSISGTQTFQHLGVYLSFTEDAGCTGTSLSFPLTVLESKPGQTTVQLPPTQRVAVRVNGGFWSDWQSTDATGRLTIEHPRLWLVGEHAVELRTEDGATAVVRTRIDPR